MNCLKISLFTSNSITLNMEAAHFFELSEQTLLHGGKFVDRDNSVGTATRYRLDGPGIEYCPSKWPSGLRRGSAAYRLLGLRVRILPEAWMFVLCVLHSKDKRQNAGQSRRRNKQDKAQRQNKRIKKISVGPYFSHPSTPAPGPTQPPVLRKPGLLAGGKTAGAWR